MTLFKAWLIDWLAQELGIDREKIDPRQSFLSYGMDSVQAMTMVGDLEAKLEVRLPPTLAWDYPDIDALSAHLADRFATLNSSAHQTSLPEALAATSPPTVEIEGMARQTSIRSAIATSMMCCSRTRTARHNDSRASVRVPLLPNELSRVSFAEPKFRDGSPGCIVRSGARTCHRCRDRRCPRIAFVPTASIDGGEIGSRRRSEFSLEPGTDLAP